uniref:Putative salivary galectin n=1 Tax=Anopheles braziliensis TaxID=58242 RepID=A0A2M3ZE12_9DIPT
MRVKLELLVLGGAVSAVVVAVVVVPVPVPVPESFPLPIPPLLPPVVRSPPLAPLVPSSLLPLPPPPPPRAVPAGPTTETRMLLFWLMLLTAEIVHHLDGSSPDAPSSGFAIWYVIKYSGYACSPR